MNPRKARVLITGASAGIGAATAKAFAGQECALFLVARRQEALDEVATSCRNRGALQVVSRLHDLSLPLQGREIVQECLESLGGLDILVCNAGYGLYGPIESIEPAEMARQWQVNFQSGFESIHAALPYLRRQRHGHIVLVSSIIGKKALPFASAYCSTKSAQAALGESLWGELRPLGIGVSVICPGFTATEFHAASQRRGGYQPFRRPFKGQDPRVIGRGIVEAVRRNRREVHFTLAGKALLLLNRISPSLASRMLALAVGGRAA